VACQLTAMYSLKDLVHARTELQRCIDTYDEALATLRAQLAAEIRAASRRVREIEDALATQGSLEPDGSPNDS
jgi:hypothetical protein